MTGVQTCALPIFDRETVKWCVESDIAVTPGCVTPTEIMEAISLGLKVVKFFPANVYGGLTAMKSLSGPFGNIKFIPTGGVNEDNLGDYIKAPFIHAVGGSWVCAKKDISQGYFERITKLCREAREKALGFEMAHVGINCQDAEKSLDVCKKFQKAFGFAVKEGNSSNFSTSGIEVMKSNYFGDKGHIAIRTNKLEMAVRELERNGFEANMETATIFSEILNKRGGVGW